MYSHDKIWAVLRAAGGVDKRLNMVNNKYVGREPLQMFITKDSFFAPYGFRFNAITAIENASSSIITLSTIAITSFPSNFFVNCV